MAKREDRNNDGKFAKGNNIGVQFGSGQDATKGGRPLKIYTVLKEHGYGQDDIRAAFGEIAFYDHKGLESLHNDEEKPAIVRIVARTMLNAIKSGRYHEIKDIIEQLIGRAKETKEINATLLGAHVVIHSEGTAPKVID